MRCCGWERHTSWQRRIRCFALALGLGFGGRQIGVRLQKKSFSLGGRCFSADVNCVLSTGFSP